ncbi:YicC/YloC family endoribonuclease [Thermolongibacillus altinsuensis]
MILSMTGFGRSKKENENMSIMVEMKSVNHRFCEISIRMPRQWMMFEDKIKKVVMEHVSRGRVEVFVTIQGEELVERKLQVDWRLLDEYNEVLTQMCDRFGLQQDVSLLHFLSFPHAMEVIEEPTKNEEIVSLLVDATKEAALQLRSMREQEGKALLDDLLQQLEKIEQCAKRIEMLAPKVVAQYRERIHKRVSEFLQGTVDENRILTEVAIFAEKIDINEELKRIYSHIEQFRMTVRQQEAVGRKLDFLVQELNREINTIGSKANDHEIAAQVVEMKSALEKIKEQVQNVE